MLKRGLLIILTMSIVNSYWVFAGFGEGEDTELVVGGVIGVTPSNDNTYLALFIPLNQVSALNGFLWYNNDSLITFPKVFVNGGEEAGPDCITDSYLVEEDVIGNSLDWSEIIFQEPIAPINNGLYVIFQIPEGGECEYEGDGGGAGIGYFSGDIGMKGWMSVDGQEWIKLHESYSFAVLPDIIPVEPGMLTMNDSFNIVVDEKPNVEEDGGEISENLKNTIKVQPNPFNPATDITFTLSDRARVRISVYNLRGECIRKLTDMEYNSGIYSITWRGRDRSNRSVPSGTYILAGNLGDSKYTRKVTLVR